MFTAIFSCKSCLHGKSCSACTVVFRIFLPPTPSPQKNNGPSLIGMTNATFIILTSLVLMHLFLMGQVSCLYPACPLLFPLALLFASPRLLTPVPYILLSQFFPTSHPTVPRLSPSCFPLVTQLFSACLQVAPRLSPNCSPLVFKLFLACHPIYIVLGMSQNCSPFVFQLFRFPACLLIGAEGLGAVVNISASQS